MLSRRATWARPHGPRHMLRETRRMRMEMTAVGFEPTQLALVELESTPLDHSGKLSLRFHQLRKCGRDILPCSAVPLRCHRSALISRALPASALRIAIEPSSLANRRRAPANRGSMRCNTSFFHLPL